MERRRRKEMEILWKVLGYLLENIKSLHGFSFLFLLPNLNLRCERGLKIARRTNVKTEKSGKHENGLCDKKMKKGQLFSFPFCSPFQHTTTTATTTSNGLGWRGTWKFPLRSSFCLAIFKNSIRWELNFISLLENPNKSPTFFCSWNFCDFMYVKFKIIF